MKKLLLAAALVLLTACDKELVCPTGEAACGDRCVPLLTDAANCGACGAACGPLEICSGGACTCAPDVASCGGVCTDVERDPDHCGGCSVACAADAFCTPGLGCTASCDAGLTACGRACVDLAADRRSCGSCGHACAAGQACRDGECRADLQVACLNTSEVVPVTSDLVQSGRSRPTPSGPMALALLGDAVYAANGWPAASVSIIPLDDAAPGRDVEAFGNDLEQISAWSNVLLVSNAGAGTLLVMGAAGDLLDEIPLPDQQLGPNPHGIAVVGTTGYVALYGNGPSSGQKIAKVDLSALAACAAPDPDAPACSADGACPEGRGCLGGVCRIRCGAVTGTIDLLAIPGAYDAPGLPLPDGALAVNGRVYVTLPNLADDPNDAWTFYVKPAGSGRLAVIDTGAGDAVSIVDLGAACWKPSALAVRGTTLWIGCGSLSFPELAPGRLLPVDVSGATPVVGTPLDVPSIVPSRLAFCGGLGYVGDQASGAVLRFDPVSLVADAPAPVCVPDPYGFASVSDIACSN